MQTYTLLTVGDGLISQIPALFLAITSAIIVTRVGTEQSANLGSDIIGQLVAERRALRLAAVVLFGMAFIPGFPAVVFVVLSATFALASIKFGPKSKEEGAVGVPAGAKPGESAKKPEEEEASVPVVRVLLAPDLYDAVGRAPNLPRALNLAQQQVAEELGISCPAVGYEAALHLEGHQYLIEIEGVPMEQADARPKHILLRDDPAHLDLLGLPHEAGPAILDNVPACWVDASHAPRLLEAGLGYNDCAEVIAWQARNILRKHAPNFLGIQETKALLQKNEKAYPDLVREVTRVLPIQKIAELLRRLLEEHVSIRSFRLILEALADWGERESRVILLTEYVRAALGRQICHRYANPHKVLSALIVEQDVEQVMREALRETAVGVYLALDSGTSDRLVDLVRVKMANINVERATPIIITSLDIRRYLRTLLVKNGLDIPVLSYQDLAADFPVQPLGSIGFAAVAEPAQAEMT